MLGKFVSGMFY